jgi:hypothetical protein
MDISLLSRRIEQIAVFSRRLGLPVDSLPAAPVRPEITELRQELENMTSLYEESLCVWEHEMQLLKTRLAETGNRIRKMETMQNAQAAAAHNAAVKTKN